MDFLEDLIEEVIARYLPRAKLSEDEVREIKKSVKEMKSA